MIDEILKNEIRSILFRFLDAKKDKVFIFGSRVTGGARKFSDIDIGIMSDRPIPWGKLIAIEEELEGSDLPYTFDIVDFRTVSENFKKVVGENIVSLN